MGTKFKGIKTVAEYRRGEIGRDILRLIEAGVIEVGRNVTDPRVAQIIDTFTPKNSLERRRIWTTIKYLEAKNRISLEEHNGHTYAVLTERGRLQINEDAIWNLAIITPRRWDHKWRIVLFDIPRVYEKKRKPFRLKLEDLGFRMYQKSVFIYPYECHEEVHTIAKWYGVDKHIRYIVATEVHDMRHFVEIFDLL